MARHLSWIDNDKLSNLFNRVGSSRGRAPVRARGPAVQRPPEPAPEPSAQAHMPPPMVQRRPVAPPPKPIPQPAVRPAAPPVAQAPVAPQPVAPQPVPPAPIIQQIIVAPEPEPEPEPFVPSDSELFGRMYEYLDWVIDVANLTGCVLADSDGLIIAHRHGSQLEAALTLGLGTMLRQVGDILCDTEAERLALHGHVALEHDGRYLISLWAPTDQGTCYGVLIGDSVPAGNVLKLAEQGLRTVFAE